MGALAHAVRLGKALYVGLSNYAAEETARAATLLQAMGVPCLVHQPRYNLFDRWVEKNLLDVLSQEGIGCIAFSPLAQGLLSERYFGGIPQGSRASKSHGFLRPGDVTDEKIGKARRLSELASARGQSLAQFALAWVLHHRSLTSVLIGASSKAQVEEDAAAVNRLEFDAQELQAIDAILAE